MEDGASMSADGSCVPTDTPSEQQLVAPPPTDGTVDNLLQLPRPVLCTIATLVSPSSVLRMVCRTLRETHDEALELLVLQVNTRALNVLARPDAARRMPRVRSVRLEISGAVPLAPLTTLTYLRSLNLDSNLQAADAGQLSVLTALTQLTMPTHNIDISWIQALTQLQHLHLIGNLSDMQPLSTLSSLTYLHFLALGKTPLPPLTFLSSLRHLSLVLNHDQPPPLPSSLTQLHLICKDTTRSMLESIAALTGLQHLQLLTFKSSGKAPSAECLAPLTSLTQLTHLYLDPPTFTPMTALPNLADINLLLVPASLDQEYGPSQLHLVTAMRALKSLTLHGHSSRSRRVTVTDLSDMLRHVCQVTGLQQLKVHGICTADSMQLDVSQLLQLSQLSQLELHFSCHLSGTQHLSSLTGLKELSVESDIPLSHFSPLTGLTSLQYNPRYSSASWVEAQGGWSADLTPLSTLSLLEHLCLGDSPVGRNGPPIDLGPLRHLRKLRSVHLPSLAPLTSVKPLTCLESLTALTLCGVTPEDTPCWKPFVKAKPFLHRMLPFLDNPTPATPPQPPPSPSQPTCDLSHISLLTSLKSLVIDALQGALPASHFTTLSELQQLELRYNMERMHPVRLSDAVQLSCLSRLTYLSLGGAEVPPLDIRQLSQALPRLRRSIECGTIL